MWYYLTLLIGIIITTCESISFWFLNDRLCNIPILFNPIIYILLCILYIRKYRSQNLFCFEFIFFIVNFIIIYFNVIVFDILDESGPAYGMAFLGSRKADLVNMIAFYSVMIGFTTGNHYKINIKHKLWNNYLILHKEVDFLLISRILTLIIITFSLYLATSGEISSWFHYGEDNAGSGGGSNTNLVYLTVLFMCNSVIEFSRLSKNKVKDISTLIKNINIPYCICILLISIILLISGNRNESLLIIIPPILLYSIFIQQISNRMMLWGVAWGWLVMTVIGVLRSTGDNSSSDAEIGAYESVRDFAFANMSTTYLINETDKAGPIYFNDAVPGIASSIPFLGGVVNMVIPRKYYRSLDETTYGILGPNPFTGLGTSLTGDLYYFGGLPFVIIYLVLLGYLVSFFFNKFTFRKKYNIWEIILYAFLFSNVVYCLRAEWLMPFRYVGFSYFIIFILSNTFIIHKSK